MRRLLVLIKNLITIPRRLFFTRISIFSILQEVDVNKKAAIASGVKFYRGRIGKYSYINRNCFITDTDIGAFSSIGTGCEIGGASHPLEWISTSSVFHKWENILHKNFSRHDFEIFHRTTIGNDVWIGTNCMIKAGLHINDGAIIGMGAIVTKDVGAYEIWAGNPARLIRKRFKDDMIEDLLKIQWWNLDDNEIEDLAEYVPYPERFIEESCK